MGTVLILRGAPEVSCLLPMQVIEQQQQRHQKSAKKQKQSGVSRDKGVDGESVQKADSSAAEVAASAGGQQAEGSFMYGGGGGSVLLFDAGDPCPRAAWLLPG